jgi:hypothetical protein
LAEADCNPPLISFLAAGVSSSIGMKHRRTERLATTVVDKEEEMKTTHSDAKGRKGESRSLNNCMCEKYKA